MANEPNLNGPRCQTAEKVSSSHELNNDDIRQNEKPKLLASSNDEGLK